MWGSEEQFEAARAAVMGHVVPVGAGWCAPPPTRKPQVGETWRGMDHGSLFKVLAVDGGPEDEWVTYLVMYQGNDYWMRYRPPGMVLRGRMEGWLTLMEYAPEWNG